MDDLVPFKVYTFWSDDGSKPEVRRFGVEKDVVSNYNYLRSKLQEVFPKLKNKTFTISWQDEDGDDVTLSSDEELLTMLAAVSVEPHHLYTVKLRVHVEKTPSVDEPNVSSAGDQSDPTPANSATTDLHAGVVCDGCNRGVIGFRYKCITCNDFDLCAHCESQRVHSEHCVVRIPSPKTSLCVIKESIKKSRQFLKSVAINMHEEAKRQKAAERKAGVSGTCPKAPITVGHGFVSMRNPGVLYVPSQQYHFRPVDKHTACKERREEKQEKRQERREERNERREERNERREENNDNQEERRERDTARQPRRSVGWVDVFSKYVDQFANLAADHIRNAGADNTDPSQQAAQGNPDLDKMMKDCEFECPLLKLNRDFTKIGEFSLLHLANTNVSPSAAQEANATPSTSTATTATPQASTSKQAMSTPQAQATTAPQAQATTAPQVPTAPQAPATPSQDTTAAQATIPQATTTPIVPTTQQAPLTPPTTPTATKREADYPKLDTKSESGSISSNEFISRDGTPDKAADDWTMINQEKDMESESGAGEANAAPIDVLPEEFRRPLFNHGQLYPPLNTATAVYDPKDAVEIPVKSETAAPASSGMPAGPSRASASANQASTSAYQASASASASTQGPSAGAKAGNAKPSAPVAEQRHHHVPHIDAAIRQMISMGFTNEGGWLTQLLASKDGNIAAVLDLLTPVNPLKK